MDFNIKNLWILTVGGVEIWITETIFNTWIMMLLLIALAVVVRIMLRKFEDVPKGVQNVIESLIEIFDNFVKSSAGERFMFLGSWFFMVFIFMLIANLSGLVGVRPPTADWATTFAFALSTFILIQILGIKNRKGSYFKSFFEPMPLFFPLNLLGELARPVSLSFRLYGNVLAGTILMALVYTLAPVYVRFAIPTVLHVYFDVFSGSLQTYIFCILSLSYISAAATEEEA